MYPIILHTYENTDIQSYIIDYAQSHKISSSYIIKIEPEKKQLSIDQIRMIKKYLIYTQENHKIIFIDKFDTATQEAQNAFLKTLEEHNANIHFILIAHNLYKILPTVRSRCRIIRFNEQNKEKKKETPSPLIEDIITTLKKEVSVSSIFSHKSFFVKTKEESIALIDSLISYFQSCLISDKQKAPHILKRCIELRSLIQTNNTNPQLTTDALIFEIAEMYKK